MCTIINKSILAKQVWTEKAAFKKKRKRDVENFITKDNEWNFKCMQTELSEHRKKFKK